MKHLIFLCVAALILSACVSGSALITGTKRDPIDPSEVKVYRSSPDVEYKQIGMVQSEAEEVFSQQEALDRAEKELKKQAAKIGANGVVLLKMGEKQESFANYTPQANGSGFFTSGTSDYQVLQADAIYVDE